MTPTQLDTEIRKAYKIIKKMIEQHGKVRIIFQEYNPYNRGKAFEPDGGMRRRLIKKNGECFLSYKGRGYAKWSRYNRSCFTCDVNITDFKHTISRMKNHDTPLHQKLRPIEIHYGWFFLKKLQL